MSKSMTASPLKQLASERRAEVAAEKRRSSIALSFAIGLLFLLGAARWGHLSSQRTCGEGHSNGNAAAQTR